MHRTSAAVVDVRCIFWYLGYILSEEIIFKKNLVKLQIIISQVKVKKVCLYIYSAVFSQLDRSNRFTFFATPWHTCSFRHELGFSGQNQEQLGLILVKLIRFCSRPDITIVNIIIR